MFNGKALSRDRVNAARRVLASRESQHRQRCLRMEQLEARALLAVVSLNPVKDNTLYETNDGSLSNGAGQHFFAGATGQGAARNARRGLLAFDVAGDVPAGATINSATLTLHMSRTTAGVVDVSAHRLLADWGEGASAAPMGEGVGAPATAGDATWLHTFFPGGRWSTPGGDFAPTASATTTVNQIGFYTWQSTAQLVADVERWLDAPQENFGWLLSDDQGAASTAKRFDSRQNSVTANRPVLTIDFSDPAVVPEITIDDVTVPEGDAGITNFQFTVRLSQATAVPVTVDVATFGGTAAAGEDFATLPATMLTFAPGETVKTVNVQVVGDVTVEADETFELRLAGAVGATIADAVGLGTITNDDTTELSIDDVARAEGDSGSTPFVFTVSLSAPSDSPVEVAAATANDTATAGVDYNPLSQTRLTFAPGQTQVTVTVQVNGDTTVESDETFQVRLTSAVGATIADGTGVGTILNDDIVDISIDDVALPEGDIGETAFPFAVRLSAASDLPVTVTVETADETATAGDDYTATGPIIVQFAAGETVKTVTVTVLGDELAEGDETFLVNLRDAMGARIIDDAAVGTILDDETTRLFVDDVTLAEGDDGETVFEFVVRLSNPSELPVTATVSTADQSARAGEDYQSLTGAIVEFAPGEMQRTVTVVVFGERRVEPDETFVLTLSDAVGAVIADATAQGTIINDDLVRVSVDDASVDEGDAGTSPAAVVVRLSEPSPVEVMVQLTTADDTATAGVDYTPLTSAPLVFAVGESEKIVPISINGDVTVEPDETFLVEIASAAGAQIADATGVVTIVNDDQANLVIDDVTQQEGDAGATDFAFTVRLSASSRSPVTVDISTVGGTATSGVDFLPPVGQSLVFAPGGPLEQQVVVQVIGDVESEPDERFEVVLSGAVGAVISRGRATGTILDDDGRAGSLSGFVFSDTNDNGRRDSHEIGIAGVTVELSGVDFQGAPLRLSQATNIFGQFMFANLPPGTYALVETQPVRYLDGLDDRGTPDVGPPTGTVGNDRIAQIALGSGVNISEINFGERGLRPELIHKRLFHSNTPVPEPVAAQVATTADTSGWVHALYVDVLGRAPADAEAAWWNVRLAGGTPRADVVAAFVAGEEYRGRAIDALYQEYLGRAADPRGRRYWLDHWPAANGRDVVAAGILASPEYFGKAGASDPQFIDALYQDVLGRDATSAETSHWTGKLAESSRGDVARRFLASDERLLDLVAAWHLQYLHRQPTPAEAALSLRQREAGIYVEQMQWGVLASDEYEFLAEG